MLSKLVPTKLLDPQELLTKHLDLKMGEVIGDLGCGGAGYFTLPAARLVGSKGKIYAVDILKSALDGVRGQAKLDNVLNIETVWSDLERVGAASITVGSLDAALLINIMYQSRNNMAILDETKRLLKGGGRILVVDWKVEQTPFGPPVNDRMSPDKVREFALKVGLKEDKQFLAGPYHYGFIFVK